jgi:hypothetical protein
MVNQPSSLASLALDQSSEKFLIAEFIKVMVRKSPVLQEGGAPCAYFNADQYW